MRWSDVQRLIELSQRDGFVVRYQVLADGQVLDDEFPDWRSGLDDELPFPTAQEAFFYAQAFARVAPGQYINVRVAHVREGETGQPVINPYPQPKPNPEARP